LLAELEIENDKNDKKKFMKNMNKKDLNNLFLFKE
jgi:hypothetical protein